MLFILEITKGGKAILKEWFRKICLFFFPIVVMPFLSLYYDFFDKGVLGIIFSCVNESPWELMKPVFWACLFWWSLELLWGVKKFKIYVKAKVISLFFLCFFCCVSNTILLYCAEDFFWWLPTAFCVALSYIFYFISNIAVKNIEKTRGFGVCVVILALMVGAVFCFSLYPPHNFLFVDNFFNTYGIAT